ncbi:MAG: hypothetical protein E7100_11120 [Bacteroidaceae bacterium]|jgi:hypothetical protein|nr:hypothetical protein [Bacteroidaceae bacterium]
MKNRIKISYFSHAFMMLAFMGAVTACVGEEDFGVDNSIKQTVKEGLAVSPIVSDSEVKTATSRAESVDALKEKTLNTLDVFVEHVTNGTGDGTFMKQYHLPFAEGEGGVTPGAAVQEAVNNWLADRWRDEGLVDGEKYNIYVAANNPLTKSDVASVTALKALSYNEVEQGVAIVNETNNNITWGETTTSGNIYKVYDANPGSSRFLTDDKMFMMDGVIKDWTPVVGSKTQVFNVTMNRAAAKIVLNLKFDAEFLTKLQEDGVEVTGSPAWRFNNFAFGAPVFTPDTAPTTGVEVHNSDFNIFHNQDFAGDDKHATITTYSYPTVWTDATGAPSLVVSVGYTQGTGDDAVTSYNYYRIPIVPKATKSLNRNTIYVIDATIATRGSESHEDITEMDNLVYEVLPWNDETNSAAIHNDVESVQHYYFKVNPKIYTLRGDGDQDVVLTYLKAAGTKVNWKLFTYDNEGNQTGVVANDDDAATRGWFYNSSGAFTSTYSDNSGTDWSKMGVEIVQSSEGTSGSSGTITVTSTALNNKAIKYIRLRVYLDEEATFKDGAETMYEDIIIRHFPTDNIQNIEGLWSSYAGATSTFTLTTTDKDEADAWVTQYNGTLTTETVSDVTYIDYTTYLANASDTQHYHIDGPTATDYDTFNNMVQNMANRQRANSQANAVADGGEGHSYYWGTDVQTVATNVRYYNMGYYDYDYYTNGTQNNRYNLYKYQNYYTATYTYTSDPYTLYTVTYTAEQPSTWVDWTDQTNHTGQRTSTITYPGGGEFRAKVYQANETDKIWSITDQQQGYGNTYRTVRGNTSGLTGLNNPHMYVIQISSTSDDYVLGRPILGNPSANQSRDDVVSPAFMIASQLGAVQVFTGNNAPTNAAEHCSLYKEVTADGTAYTGWRLPTQAEIRVISRYQNGTINNVQIPATYRTMTAVLTGERYWCLSGNRINTQTNQIVTTGNSYLRCVRDLSAAEVEALNGFDAIVEKYQK